MSAARALLPGLAGADRQSPAFLSLTALSLTALSLTAAPIRQTPPQGAG